MNYSHILYHANCPDGFGAAYAAWKKFGDAAKYIPINYGDPFPELPKSADVLMVDVSYPTARHFELRDLVNSVMVVDHHASAMNDIGALPNTHFDMNHSGAVLSWRHLHKGAVPDLLLYIEDKDLWRFKLEHSREVSAALASYRQDFSLWDSFRIHELVQDGTSILRLVDQKVSEMCDRAFYMKIAGHEVPVVNATLFGSEIGNMLCKMNPHAPFAAYYFEKEKLRCWGLRSIDRMDVSLIAKKFGGGGHPNAAGFTEPIERPLSLGE